MVEISKTRLKYLNPLAKLYVMEQTIIALHLNDAIEIKIRVFTSWETGEVIFCSLYSIVRRLFLQAIHFDFNILNSPLSLLYFAIKVKYESQGQTLKTIEIDKST